jgi:hypothetical protein
MKPMSPRERLTTVIKGGIPDRVPVTVHQWQDYHLKHFMGGQRDLEAFIETGLDAVCYPVEELRNPESQRRSNRIHLQRNRTPR